MFELTVPNLYHIYVWNEEELGRFIQTHTIDGRKSDMQFLHKLLPSYKYWSLAWFLPWI